MRRFLGVLLTIVLVCLLAVGLSSLVLAQPPEVWVDDDFTASTPGWGTTHFDSIQDGIDAVASPGTIHVADGTYYENIELVGGVQVLGAGASVTTIDGSTARAGLPAYHVVVGAGNATLDGLTITGGNADGAGNDSIGGGMFNYHTSPTVTNCTFYNNSAWDGGGGMYNENSSTTVTNCTFLSNSTGWGGGMYNAQSSPMVINCTFSNNSASNGGGGMYNYANSSPTTISCIFSDNPANWGGGMHNKSASSPMVTNCIFHNNTATSWGGGMNNDESSPIITNCTFSNNVASTGGSGMSNGGSSPTVTNCILWNNGDEIVNDVTSTPLVTYCDIQGGYSGVGNINAYPMFVNPTGGNFHLISSSPCIDAGINVGAPTDDIEGTPRPIDGDGDSTATTDMGAYEYVQLMVPTVTLWGGMAMAVVLGLLVVYMVRRRQMAS